ncbi:MAG TPA: phosphodiesterase [Solirubrobacteraceae bacterium]
MSAPEPFLLVQLSDAHVRDDDPQPERMFADAVRDVAAIPPAPGAVLVSGDLTEHGLPHEYERVRELLSALAMPVHVLGGNHDDRENLRASFPVPGGDDGGEDYRYATRCGPLRLVAIDTTDPGRIEGRLGDERLAWLDARLAEERETPTVVAMHHPPLLLGIAAWDEIGLPDGDRAALGEIIAGHPHVRRVLAGHVHRAALGSVGGCPVFTCPSTWIQGRLDFAHPDELSVVAEPPCFAVHLAVAGELTTHVQPVGEW